MKDTVMGMVVFLWLDGLFIFILYIISLLRIGYFVYFFVISLFKEYDSIIKVV